LAHEASESASVPWNGSASAVEQSTAITGTSTLIPSTIVQVRTTAPTPTYEAARKKVEPCWPRPQAAPVASDPGLTAAGNDRPH
jgi:hypothetical protein